MDVAIIGAGTAGLSAHAAARDHADSVLLIEGGPYGTTCARVGCMPSKLLIAAADVRRRIEQAATFGIHVGSVSVNGAAVMQRVQSMRDDFVASVIDAVEAIPAEQRLRGMARFEAPNRLRVGDVTVHAQRVVIATGSEPVLPDAFRGLDRVLTSDSVFELETLPESIAVIGGGAIGLELGQAFHSLGVRTRLFHRDATLGPRGDARITQVATELLAASMPCELATEAQPVAHDASGIELEWRDATGQQRREHFAYVLVAAGRRPRLEALQLEHSGLSLDARGVPHWDRATARCGNSGIYIAGDADADRPVLHAAADDGRLAGSNAGRHPDVRPIAQRTALAIAFTEPQYATVGASPAEFDAATVATGEVSFEKQGRSRVIGRAAGLGRLYAAREGGRLLGAQLVGPAAEHLAHLMAWVIERGLTVDEILTLPFYHPVIEEGLRTALKDLRRELRNVPAASCMDCGPGG